MLSPKKSRSIMKIHPSIFGMVGQRLDHKMGGRNGPPVQSEHKYSDFPTSNEFSVAGERWSVHAKRCPEMGVENKTLEFMNLVKVLCILVQLLMLSLASFRRNDIHPALHFLSLCLRSQCSAASRTWTSGFPLAGCFISLGCALAGEI